MTQARNLADSGVQLPLLTVLWWGGSRSSIPAGFAPTDGQVMSRSTYPDAWAFVSGGGWTSVTDAVWTANPNQRNKFSTGDGSTTFRLPDINGKSVGSLGALFLRGDGTLSESSGNIQTDALQNIIGQFESRRMSAGEAALLDNQSPGAFDVYPANGGAQARSTATVGASLSADVVNFDASRVARTSTETRPLNAPGCYIIKLADEALNYSGVNMVQLASDVAAMKPTVDKAYVPANIVGTVSQTGGVPTGRVIERGSNSNGEYVKYADGTQICWNWRTEDVAISTAFQNGYLSSMISWTFPVPFVGIPVAIAQGRRGGGASWVLNNGSSGSTSFAYYHFAFTSYAAGTLTATNMMVTGRWY